LLEAGINRTVVDAGARNFIKNSIKKSEENRLITCYSDITNALYANYLFSLFPESKFIMIIRDGRAMVNSINKNNIEDHFFQQNSMRSMLNWNNLNEVFISSCIKLGSLNCLIIFFEQLIIDPKREIQKISKFLNMPIKKFNYNLDKSKIEKSLNSWIGKISKHQLSDEIAPMLKKLGYDSKSEITNYAELYEKLNKNLNFLENYTRFDNFMNISENKALNFANDIFKSSEVVYRVIHKN
jgi:protein-tyrosine sulfotransferase